MSSDEDAGFSGNEPDAGAGGSADQNRLAARHARNVAQLEWRLARTTAELDTQQQRVGELEDEKTKLADDLATARWKLKSTTSRKWWRIGQAIGRARSSVRGLLLLPFDIARIVFGHSDLPKRPEPQRPLKAEAYTGEVPAPGAAETFANLGSRSTAAAMRAPDQQTDDPDSPLVPLLVVAPSSMSLAPPPVSTTKDLRVASILDEMSHQSFAPECHLITFSPHNWLEVLEREMPNLLLVESAWRGNSGSWEYKVGTYNEPGSVGLPDLAAIVRWCQREGVPTVFWNKEDPVHFQKFKEAAALFDVVLTSDANMVPNYRNLPGMPNRVVGALPFAAQPVIHNPIGSLATRDKRPVFAGAYYRNRHESRRMELDVLLDAAMPHGLVIYDRMGGAVSDSFGFPDRFQTNIAGTLPYEDMVQTYRQHRVFLNVNSVSDSPTMFSRRVYELLASGTPVVSTPSRGVEELFGDVIDIVTTQAEAEQAIRRLVEDDDWWLERSTRGIEAVFSGHTYADRLETIATTAGLPVAASGETVAFVIGQNSSISDRALAALDPATEIYSLSGSTSDDAHDTPRTIRRIDIPSDAPSSDIGPAVAKKTDADWLAFVSTDADLKQIPHLVVGTRVAQAEIIVPAHDRTDMHRFVADPPTDGALLASRDFVQRTSWSPWATDGARMLGARVYSVPTFDD